MGLGEKKLQKLLKIPSSDVKDRHLCRLHCHDSNMDSMRPEQGRCNNAGYVYQYKEFINKSYWRLVKGGLDKLIIFLVNLASFNDL